MNYQTMDIFISELTSKNASEMIKQMKGKIVDGKDSEVEEHSSGIMKKFSRNTF